MLGRHLYLSLSWQVVSLGVRRGGSLRTPARRSRLLCISPRTAVPVCILISVPSMHAGPSLSELWRQCRASVEYSTGVPRCPPQCVRSVRGQGRALTPLPSGSKGVPVWDFSSHPPTQLELEHFRHLSVESIVHTRTSVGLVQG